MEDEERPLVISKAKKVNERNVVEVLFPQAI